jgi:hypothetical protein
MSIHTKQSFALVICVSKSDVKLTVVAVSKSRSAAYFVYGCQKNLYKQAREANHRASFAVENPVNRPTSILSQLSSTQISQAINQANEQAVNTPVSRPPQNLPLYLVTRPRRTAKSTGTHNFQH